MSESVFRISLYLPAQGATEIEATIIEWKVAEGDRFEKGQLLAVIDSVKSVFDFEAPCSGRVVHVFRPEGDTLPYTEPVLEIETSDEAMKNWIPPASASAVVTQTQFPAALEAGVQTGLQAVIRGVGGYLPQRVVTNAELLHCFPDITDDYIFKVTSIRERRWAAEGEKPSDMAFAAALEAIRKSGLRISDVDAVIVATTTPDMVMPATACFLQDRLGLGCVPAFDLNAACSGWLYAVEVARGLLATGMAHNVLTVGVDMQSRLLDKTDRNTCFIFGDGAGAAIISAGEPGHPIRCSILGSDVRGASYGAAAALPGYEIADGRPSIDPWIRLDGPALYRLASESFTTLIDQVIAKAGWTPEDTRWVIPHQANGRILRSAAKRSGVPFDRFYMNMEQLGNTSSASIPLALSEAEPTIQPGDKLVLCSVGAGASMAALAVEW